MPVERSLGQEIHLLSNLIGRTIDNSPARMHVDDATGKNMWIIGYIAEHAGDDVFQKDLERQFGVTRSTVSKAVNLMVHKGLIERQGIPDDARLKKLVLTPRSWELLDQIETEIRSMEETLTAGFTEAEIDFFFDCVRRMQENIRKQRK